MSNSDIPCEICDQLIPIEDYQSHLSTCITNRLFHIDFVIDDRERRVFTHNDDTPEEEEDIVTEDEEHEPEEDHRRNFSLNNQVVSGRNLNGFLRQYLSGHGNMAIVFSSAGLASSNELRMREIDLNDYELNLEIARRMGGNVKVGLKDIDAVSIYVPKPIDERNEEDICPICRDVLGGEEGLARELLCHHIFCDTCISTWLQSSKKCPLCICDLEEAYQKKIESI